MTTTINVKIPIKVLTAYSKIKVRDRNEIFKSYLSSFQKLDKNGYLMKYPYDPNKQLEGAYTTIGIKIDKALHSDLKLAAIQQGVNLNDYAGQVITQMAIF